MNTTTPFRFVTLAPTSPSWNAFAEAICTTGLGREAFAALCVCLAERTAEDYRLSLLLPSPQAVKRWIATEALTPGRQLLIEAVLTFSPTHSNTAGVLIAWNGYRFEAAVHT